MGASTRTLCKAFETLHEHYEGDLFTWHCNFSNNSDYQCQRNAKILRRWSNIKKQCAQGDDLRATHHEMIQPNGDEGVQFLRVYQFPVHGVYTPKRQAHQLQQNTITS